MRPSMLVDRQVVDLVAGELPHRLVRRMTMSGQMLGRELRPLQGADVGFAVELVHLGAEVAQPPAAIARGAAADEFRNGLVEQRIVVIAPLERDQRGEQRPGLARFDAGRQQEEQRVEIVLLRHDAVLAQNCATTGAGMPCSHRRRSARSKPGVSSVSLFGIGHGVAGPRYARSRASARRARAPNSAGWSRARRSAPSPRAALRRSSPSRPPAHLHRSGTKGSKNQRRAGSRSFSSNSRRIARIFLRSSMPSRIVSSHKTSP